MNVLAGFADVFRKSRYKSGNIMMRFRFNFVDTVYGKGRFFTDFRSSFLRHVA